MPFPLLLIVPIVAVASVGTMLVTAIVPAVVKKKKMNENRLGKKPKGPPRPPKGTARQDLIHETRERLEMDIVKFYNVAFAGSTNVGKSTLINALREREDVGLVPGESHNAFGSAPTGEWQTTMRPLCYGCPEGHRLENVRFHDMPGIGTTENPSATYFKSNGLHAMDVILLLIDREPGEYEYIILNEAQKSNIAVAIVVTKAEEKVASKISKAYNDPNVPYEHYVAVFQEVIRESEERVSSCLERKNLAPVPVFVVSANEYRKFCADEANFIPTSCEETNGSHSSDEQSTVQNENNIRIKRALFASGAVDLMEYISKAAHERRL